MDRTFNLPFSARKTAFIGTLVLILLLATAGTIFAASPGPTISSQNPASNSTLTTSNNWFNVSFVATDSEGIKSTSNYLYVYYPSSTPSVPGTSSDYYSITPTPIDSTSASFSKNYNNATHFKEGKHKLVAKIYDNGGTYTNTTWYFTLNTGTPTASEFFPAS